MTPKVIDNDRGDITVEVFGKEVRGWSYKDDAERRTKMLAAHEYAEGWHNALARMKERLDLLLNNCLCEMKEGYDDSIVGFNEAWDIVRKAFAVTEPAKAECIHRAGQKERGMVDSEGRGKGAGAWHGRGQCCLVHGAPKGTRALNR